MQCRIDLEAAKNLRSEGFTYQEIAFRLGCSKAWCAKALRSVPKGAKSPAKLSGEELRQQTLSILETAMQEIRALK